MNATLVVLFSNKSNVGPIIAEGKKKRKKGGEIEKRRFRIVTPLHG